MNKQRLNTYKISIDSGSFFWCAVSLFSAMVIARDVLDVGISRWLFIAIGFVVCVLCSKNHIYLLLAFLAPMASGVSYTYISLIALACLLVRYKLHVSKIGFGAMLFILVWELLQGFRGMFDIMNYLRFAGVFVIAFLHMLDTDRNVDHLQLIKMYLIGYVVAMVDLLAQFLKVYSFGELLKLNLRLGDARDALDLGMEGMRVSYNPNGLGTVCILVLIFSLLLIRKEKRLAVYIPLALFSGLIGFATQSRTYLVVLLVSMIAYVLLSCTTFKSALKTIAGSVGLFCLLYCIILWFLPNYLKSFINRWNVEDISNGRVEIMRYYTGKMFDSIDRFLFGVGMQNYPKKYGFSMSAHNATQELLITWGVVGVVVVIVLFGAVLYNAKKKNKGVLLVQFLPLFSVLLYKQAGQGFIHTASMLWMMVAYSATRIELTSTKKVEKESG